MFRKMKPVPTADEILDKAFSRSRKSAMAVKAQYKNIELKVKELKKIETSTDVITSALEKITSGCPYVLRSSPFYQELISATIDVEMFRKSAAAVKWAKGAVDDMYRTYKVKAKGTRTRNLPKLRNEYYGRVSSILKQIKRNLAYLETSRRVLKDMPLVKEMHTVVIAGLPNSGKSSLLSAITGARPDIQPYPFTTKKVLVGYIGDTVQLIDTPGMLDRKPSERNDIERHAVMALKHLANEIIYVFDVSVTAYDIDKQASLLKQIRNEFSQPLIVVANKSDEAEKDKMDSVRKLFSDVRVVSAKTGGGIPELKKEIEGWAFAAGSPLRSLRKP